jgi:hypothetical protein
MLPNGVASSASRLGAQRSANMTVRARPLYEHHFHRSVDLLASWACPPRLVRPGTSPLPVQGESQEVPGRWALLSITFIAPLPC